MARITIQYQETRKPHRWKNAFTARVLYADKKIILVRGCGSNSTFLPSGGMDHMGYKPAHPAAKNIPACTGSWRIHPHSVARLGRK